jgi:hypothetical protein
VSDTIEVIMETCFFCNEAIKDDDYILIDVAGDDDVAELVPAHQDCPNNASDNCPKQMPTR